MKNTDDDMSMDEILASIRRYVTDDNGEKQSDERLIRLTPDHEINVPSLKREHQEEQKKEVPLKVVQTAASEEDQAVLSDNAIRASAHFLAKINDTKPKTNISIEQLVASLIKEWLDKNMPTIVERTVQREIERIKKAM